MAKQSTKPLIEISDLAEGVPDSIEPVEPHSPLKTATIPVIGAGRKTIPPSAETGMLSAVEVAPEGRDLADAQDASLIGDETRPSPIAEQAPDTKPRSAPTVLIIEDTVELAEVIQATLERMSMVTAHETHGNKALARFHEMNPDVILLDISLPDMTGWKILDGIKEKHEQDPKAKTPAIIVITAYGDPANRLVAKLQGVYSYLIKPFTADEVEKAVTSALGSVAR